jgi:hypothetical protein
MRIRPSLCAGFVVSALAFNTYPAYAETAAVVAARTQAAIDAGQPPAWWSPELPEAVQRDVDRKGPRLAGQLELGDDAKTQKAGALITEHFARLVMAEQVDPIYAEFAPQIQGFLKNLRAEIGEEKTTELLDIITRSPGAKRTFDAYVGMVPEMTDEQKAVLWNRLEQAREDSLAAWSDGQIVKIFKKYKTRCEASIDDFGYNYRERYQAWANSQR